MKRQHGFSIIEVLVAVAVVGVLFSIGIPSLLSSIAASRANALPDFYLEGFRRARDGAVRQNSAARLVLIPNATNGQYDWRVDWCSPTSTTACSKTSGTWSTTASAVSTTAGLPPGPSILRSASNQPSSSVIAPTANEGELAVYFTSTGWPNTTVQNLRSLTFTPSDSEVLPSQISITLSGSAERCYPTVLASDSRSCP